MKFTKKTAEKYVFRGEHGSWATFTIEEADGSLQIMSDWGDWAYRWGSPGESLKSFLVGIDKGYLINKLEKGRRTMDIPKIEEEILGLIDAAIKDEKLSRFEADEAKEWVESELSQESYQHMYYQDWFSAVFESFDEVPYHTRCDPAIEAMYDNVWPLFVAELKKELGTYGEGDKDAQS